MFEAALDSPCVHVLQHWSFVFGSVLVWWAPLDPKRRRLHGELWKIGHLLGARLAGMFLGMAFVIMRSPAYDAYGDSAREHGHDAARATSSSPAAMMLGLDFLVMVFALCLFFWAAARDADEADGYSSRPRLISSRSRRRLSRRSCASRSRRRSSSVVAARPAAPASGSPVVVEGDHRQVGGGGVRDLACARRSPTPPARRPPSTCATRR